MDQVMDYSDTMDFDAAAFGTALLNRQALGTKDAYTGVSDGTPDEFENMCTNCHNTPASDFRAVGEEELWYCADLGLDSWREGDETCDVVQLEKPASDDALLEALDWWEVQGVDDALAAVSWEGLSMNQLSAESTSIHSPDQWIMPPTQDLAGYSAESAKSSGSDQQVCTVPRKRGRKKGQRKAGIEKQQQPQPYDQDHHRHIEKKYRTNLASGLARLRAKVPSLLEADEEEPPAVKLGGLTATRKRSKGTVISKAVEYIEHIERRCEAAEERAERAERVVRTCMCAAVSAALTG